MSLARALTSATKRMRSSHESTSPGETSPQRSFSTRRGFAPIDRAQISLPIELLSSTNVLAYDAPDISKINVADFQGHSASTPISASSASSARSFSDSDSAGLSSASSFTTPSISREASPIVTESNHLIGCFPENTPPSSPRSRKSNLSASTLPKAENETAPAIPARALSHTKKSHQELARKRSSSRIRSQNSSLSVGNGHAEPSLPSLHNSFSSVPTPLRSSLDTFSARAEHAHPFGAELAQVNELAEEMSLGTGAEPSLKSPVVEVKVWDEEDEFLAEHGLYRFTVEDYIKEIESLFDRCYSVGTAVWI